jgi:citrate lyase subunit beta/citryl-CoA lyase
MFCSLESALGVWNALEIARADPRILALGFGAVDFVRDIGGGPGTKGLETLYARSRLVLASRVAGIRPPVESVYAQLQDDAGLERATRLSRDLGFFGRAAIHPRQVPIINRIFTPTAEEVAHAREVVQAAAQAGASGTGALRLPSGEFVDLPVVQRAENLLRLADALGPVVS